MRPPYIDDANHRRESFVRQGDPSTLIYSFSLAMDTEAYDDGPLRGNEIRLVKLLPGRWSEPIRCELQRTILGDHPDYNTLSYVWGSRRARRHVLLNGKQFSVTVNLESALRHLRLRYENGLVIWIDALSINQNNTDERTHQVKLMGQIYRSCAGVLVYLGDGLEGLRHRENAPETVDFFGDDRDLQHINTHIDSEAMRIKYEDGPDRSTFKTSEVFAFIRALGSDIHLDRLGYLGLWGSARKQEAQMNLFEALRRLMNPPTTPWWKRIWTVQEITMPQHVLIICGPVSAPWSMFANAASRFSEHSGTCCSRFTATFPRDLWRVLLDFSSQVRDIKDLRTAHSRQKAWSESDTYGGVQLKDLTFLKLLQRFRNRQASDPRDKVYALLSLAKVNAGGPNIVPDYTLSDREVYTKATFEIMQASKSLAVLSTDTGRKFRYDLPSWVPDWSAPGAQSNDLRTDAIRLYNVVGLKKVSDIHTCRMHESSVLGVSASSIARVAQVEEVMWGDSANVTCNTILKWWMAMELEVSNGRALFSSTRFWELLCAEIFCEKLPSSSNIGVRRTTSKDEITFMSWAIDSPRSPFNMRQYPNGGEGDEQESWSMNSYYDRIGNKDLDTMSSQAAGLWKSLLYLDISMPHAHSLLESLVTRSTADSSCFGDVTSEDIRGTLSPLKGRTKDVLKKISEEHGLFWGDSMMVDDNFKDDAPWSALFWEIQDKLTDKFGQELVRSTPRLGTEDTDSTQSLHVATNTRQERIAAMDSSIMAATLSRRLFFTKDGDVGLAPADTRPGDEVFYVAGAATPLVLRAVDDDRVRHFEVVGDCYLLGMNDSGPSGLRYDATYLV